MTIRLQTGASIAAFKTPAKLLGLSCPIRQLARVVLTADTQWRMNVQYAFNFIVKQIDIFIDVHDRGVVQSRTENIAADGNCIKLA